MITRSSNKRDSQVKYSPTNNKADMTPKTSLSSKVQKRRSTTGQKQMKKNDSNCEADHSPVFNIQIHLPCTSGGNATSLPVVQPVIHLHLDSLNRSVGTVNVPSIKTEVNGISENKILRNSLSPVFKVNYCWDYDKAKNASNEKFDLKQSVKRKKINNSNDFESASPNLRRSCSLSSSDEVVEKKKVKGKKVECSKINHGFNMLSNITYNGEKVKLKDLRVQLNDIKNSCKNQNKIRLNDLPECDEQSLNCKIPVDEKESSPKVKTKLNRTYSDVSVSPKILSTEKQNSFSEDDINDDMGDESDSQEEEGGNINRGNDIDVSRKNEKSFVNMRSSGIYSSVYTSDSDDNVLDVNGDVTSLVEGCSFSEILEKLRSSEFIEKIISSGAVMSANKFINNLSNGEKQLNNAAGPSTGEDCSVEVRVTDIGKEKSDNVIEEETSQEREDLSCKRKIEFLEEKGREGDKKREDIKLNNSGNYKVQECHTESECVENETNLTNCRTDSESMNSDEVNSSSETEEETATIIENNNSCKQIESILTEEDCIENENEEEDTLKKEINGSQCVFPQTETDCFQQSGENEESSEQEFSSNEANKDSRFGSEEKKIVFSSGSESLNTTSENALELKKVRNKDLIKMDPTRLQLECIRKEMRRRELKDLPSKKKKKINKLKEKSRHGKERTKSDSNDSSQSFSSAKKKKLEPVNSGQSKNSKTKHAEDYIPLNVSGPTKFSVGMLEKINPYHDAVNLKKQLLFGNRVKRFSNPHHLNICRLKRKAAGKSCHNLNES